jgi:Flp pilus assembly pilin Flp
MALPPVAAPVPIPFTISTDRWDLQSRHFGCGKLLLSPGLNGTIAPIRVFTYATGGGSLQSTGSFRIMVEDQLDATPIGHGSIAAVVRIVMMTAASTVAVGLLIYAVGG